MDLHACSCGFETRICRYNVTTEQWATYETYFRMAYDWALDHLPVPTDDQDSYEAAEEFAARYAGEEWDSNEPYPFPAYLRSIQADEARAEAKRQEVARVEQRAEAKRRNAKWRADRRKAARSA